MEDWGKATASRQCRHKLGWFEEPDMQRNDRGVTYYILITTSSQPQNLVTTTLLSCNNVTTTPSQSITTLWSCPHNVVIILVCVITTLWLLLCAHLVLPLISPSGAWLMPIKWINCGWQFAKMLGRTEQRQGFLGVTLPEMAPWGPSNNDRESGASHPPDTLRRRPRRRRLH